MLDAHFTFAGNVMAAAVPAAAALTRRVSQHGVVGAVNVNVQAVALVSWATYAPETFHAMVAAVVTVPLLTSELNWIVSVKIGALETPKPLSSDTVPVAVKLPLNVLLAFSKGTVAPLVPVLTKAAVPRSAANVDRDPLPRTY